ncbi:ankyrin repeat domain-containing protein [Pasteurella testudinis]|uniref:ankyrin repeat domain-containing protein n=1 Tax=Pasteurella testudinis TaxID=761 RepID=UPI000E011480|nr:ankyrin repeat domain-containing protein [Pasteurella testudinis]SUB50421.1 Ankyrin repeats (3 copies) [Pasteurella testudinis]
MTELYEKYKNDYKMLVALADREGDVSLLKDIFLINKKLDLHYISADKWNWLHQALLLCKSDFPNRDVVQFYIDNGVPINSQDMYGMTPLHYAMRGKNAEAALALLEAGADPNIPDIDNVIPLSNIGGMPESLDVLTLMLEKGGNVHYYNGQHEVLEGFKKYLGSNPRFIPIIELMEKYA